jgi:hypothetical protein
MWIVTFLNSDAADRRGWLLRQLPHIVESSAFPDSTIIAFWSIVINAFFLQTSSSSLQSVSVFLKSVFFLCHLQVLGPRNMLLWASLKKSLHKQFNGAWRNSLSRGRSAAFPAVGNHTFSLIDVRDIPSRWDHIGLTSREFSLSTAMTIQSVNKTFWEVCPIQRYPSNFKAFFQINHTNRLTRNVLDCPLYWSRSFQTKFEWSLRFNPLYLYSRRWHTRMNISVR